MNMEDVKKLMKEAGWGFLGTTNGRRSAIDLALASVALRAPSPRAS